VAAERRVEIYRRKDGHYGWRRKSANNNITATSGEGYTRKADVQRAAKKQNPGLPVMDADLKTRH
jgi:uncharacterized protein YegP (UPF0339 family)